MTDQYQIFFKNEIFKKDKKFLILAYATYYAIKMELNQVKFN
jgi:hypothetical protein